MIALALSAALQCLPLPDMVAGLDDAQDQHELTRAMESRGEWGSARDCLRRFAATVNAARLPYAAICALHRDKPQLVTLDQVMDAVLKEARG